MPDHLPGEEVRTETHSEGALAVFLAGQAPVLCVEADGRARTDAPAPKVVQSATNKFALESADGQYSIGLTGRLRNAPAGRPHFRHEHSAFAFESAGEDRRRRQQVM